MNRVQLGDGVRVHSTGRVAGGRERRYRVAGILGGKAFLEGNCPLAGHTLEFKPELVSLVPALAPDAAGRAEGEGV